MQFAACKSTGSAEDQLRSLRQYLLHRPLPHTHTHTQPSRHTTNIAMLLRAWLQFYDKKQGSGYSYHGIDNWCDASHNALLNTSALPCLNMSIFSCEPISNGVLPPGIKAAIAVAAFLAFCAVMGLIAYLTLAKASKFKRYLTLSAVRLKGPPRHGRMTLVVTDIEGYSGRAVFIWDLAVTMLDNKLWSCFVVSLAQGQCMQCCWWN